MIGLPIVMNEVNVDWLAHRNERSECRWVLVLRSGFLRRSAEEGPSTLRYEG